MQLEPEHTGDAFAGTVHEEQLPEQQKPPSPHPVPFGSMCPAGRHD
jgi:hypothetical protein